MSIQIKVETRIKRIKKGIPFSINGFYELGGHAAVQKALSRLAKSGFIVRVQRGIYCRPKPLKAIPSIKKTASTEQVVRLWAKQNKYKLVPQGMEEAYRLGLQTQAPIRKVYWTNGPSKEFVVGNQKIVVVHKRDALLKWGNTPAGRLFRALFIFKSNELSLSALTIAFSRLKLLGKEANTLIKKMRSTDELAHFAPLLNNVEYSVNEHF